MGLPLFVTPLDDGISPRPSDKDTSNDRSTIRRQRTIRGRDVHSNRERIRDHLRRTGVLSSAERPNPALNDVEDAEESALVSGYMEERRRRAQMQGAPVANPSPWADRSTPPLPRLTADNSAPRVMPSNTWGWNSQPDGPLLPPAPESPPLSAPQRGGRQGYDRRVALQRLYDERAQNRQRARNAALARRAASPSRNETTPLLLSNSQASAPSRLPAPESSTRLSTWADSPFGYQFRSTAAPLPSSLSLFESNSTARRRFRIPRVDGLGDRDRSLSPEGDGAWDTLLTTISPDPQPPSVGSSFASTSASAAASSAPNSRSSATSMASSTDNADDTTFENICEYVETHSPASETDEEEVDLYELDDARAAGERFWRGYTDVVAARADRVARHAGQTDGDNMGGMQRIVRRLARREDIPDEWWAEAGLSRTLPRELVR